jgi:uncharacterized membrane protein
MHPPTPAPPRTARTPRETRTFSTDFKRFFGRGLAILLPSILTLWILWQAFGFVFSHVAAPINRGLRTAIVGVVPLVLPESSQPAWSRVPDDEVLRRIDPAATLTPWRLDELKAQTRHEIRRENFLAFWEDHWYLGGTGLAVAIILIYLAGVLLGGLIGRRTYARLESLIGRIPGFKQIYPHIKQLVDLVIGDRPLAFKRVVIIEYPRKGIWSVGLVTGASMRTIGDQAGQPCVTVFIPHSPAPFTGFAVAVPESDVIDLPLSIDEAIRYVLTSGVLIPESQVTAPPDPAIGELRRQIAAEALASRAGPSGPAQGH